MQFFFLLILSWLNRFWYILLGYLSHSDNRHGILPQHLASFRSCIIFKVAASGLTRKTGKVPATHRIAGLLSTAPFQHSNFFLYAGVFCVHGSVNCTTCKCCSDWSVSGQCASWPQKQHLWEAINRMCIFQLNNTGPCVNKQPEITNDALLTQTEIWQPQDSRCPSNVTSDTVLAIPVEQLETENTPQTPFLPLAVLSAN